MSDIIRSQPGNYNFLTPNEYRFQILRAPSLSFFVTDIRLPGISAVTPKFATPFKNIPLTPSKPEFENLYVTYKVDEDLNNYREVFNWLNDMSFSDNFDQYKKEKQGGQMLSDVSVFILNSCRNPNIEFKFEDCFPVSLSGLTLKTEVGSELSYMEATAEFAYTKYTINL